MLPFSGKYPKHQNVWSPPEHFAIGYVHVCMYIIIFVTGQYCIIIYHSQQLEEGLMVFSDDFLHFLKINKKMLNSPKLSCGFNKETCTQIIFSHTCIMCVPKNVCMHTCNIILHSGLSQEISQGNIHWFK